MRLPDEPGVMALQDEAAVGQGFDRGLMAALCAVGQNARGLHHLVDVILIARVVCGLIARVVCGHEYLFEMGEIIAAAEATGAMPGGQGGAFIEKNSSV